MILAKFSIFGENLDFCEFYLQVHKNVGNRQTQRIITKNGRNFSY